MNSAPFQIIGLDLSQRRQAAAIAKRLGKSEEEYLCDLVRRDVRIKSSLDKLLKPIRDDVRKRRLTPDEFDRIIDQARGRPR